MKTRLINGEKTQDNNGLIIYFAGWGTPTTLISHLALPKNYDLLICYDYQDLKLDFDFSVYKQIRVVAWSMGVWVANQVLADISTVSATAINGTGSPCDDDFGIPHTIFLGTLTNLNEINLVKFQRRICGNKDNFNYYQDCEKQDLSVRNIENLKSELTALYQEILKTEHSKLLNWSRVIIGKQDKIFPIINQRNYWENKCNEIIFMDIAHYPFNLFSHWSELWD
ncbi:biotin synthesis protein BioG [Bisgaardia hudsonensis]|uniref:Biotin synthesis protein BioG n=1 Tax=Bisgaardia hudsonensis TaxID=109472 RepID=A0A4R2MYN9_9PAST|nr:pimeloyl-ACP methyl esterase BioG family protein [Bisgaardia hudsonensis]QLB13578.1 hypothetical protein A6A11_08160 [Bisgaardia hudsonensis]TCP11908.1 biotin synthesis protein BioG [Bisgaardia hudsonensis]